jgi:hypothetical protein
VEEISPYQVKRGVRTGEEKNIDSLGEGRSTTDGDQRGYQEGDRFL